MTDLLAKCLNHQCGHYAVFDSGVTQGPGSTTITNTVLSTFHKNLEELLDSKPIRQVLGFCNGKLFHYYTYKLHFITIWLGAFNWWAPRLYKRYCEVLDVAIANPEYSHLCKISKKSIFICHYPNTSSSVVTVPYQDSMNLAHRWCGVC
jgi:hypothetical protein